MYGDSNTAPILPPPGPLEPGWFGSRRQRLLVAAGVVGIGRLPVGLIERDDEQAILAERR